MRLIRKWGMTAILIMSVSIALIACGGNKAADAADADKKEDTATADVPGSIAVEGEVIKTPDGTGINLVRDTTIDPYDNIQTLQRLKLAMMLDSIIEEKVKKLEEERRKKDTVERLIETHSSDVFIREVGI